MAGLKQKPEPGFVEGVKIWIAANKLTAAGIFAGVVVLLVILDALK